jgi:hypothetical protein
MIFSIAKKYGVQSFIAEMENCLYSPFEVVSTLKSTLGSTIVQTLYAGKFDFKDFTDYIELYFYGSLHSESDYKSEKVQYLIEEI